MMIILVGAPGCGKGTQSKFIADKLSYQVVVASDVLKAAITSGGSLSDVINQYISAGKLLSSNIVNEIMLHHLKSFEGNISDIILDGYPRTVEQAQFLNSAYPHLKKLIIYFDISYNDILPRIVGRYSCKSCGALYNKYFAPTTLQEICDSCGSINFIVRPDDNEQTFQTRWNLFLSDTMPVLNYYKNQNVDLLSVDATLSQAEVRDSIFSALSNYF